MASEKPSLKVILADGEQKAQPGFVLNIQNKHTVILGQFAKSGSGKGDLGNGFGEGVKQQIEDPVEHFDQEGKFG